MCSIAREVAPVLALSGGSAVSSRPSPSGNASLERWLGGDALAVREGCEVWTELASRFVGGRLVDAGAMRYWVAELAEAEAVEELERSRLAKEPEMLKAQAQERARRNVARWRLQSPRISLKWLLTADGRPLLIAAAVGAGVSAFWGGAFGVGACCGGLG